MIGVTAQLGMRLNELRGQQVCLCPSRFVPLLRRPHVSALLMQARAESSQRRAVVCVWLQTVHAGPLMHLLHHEACGELMKCALQSEHERVAKGGYDSNGEMSSAPEPLGVAYGKKIGVGGFGAVYEGEWSGKQVAVKVRAWSRNFFGSSLLAGRTWSLSRP